MPAPRFVQREPLSAAKLNLLSDTADLGATAGAAASAATTLMTNAGGRAFSTRAVAAAAAAAGSIPAIVAGIWLAGYATAGDGGEARYRRTAEVLTHTMHFADANGGKWELDEPEPHVAMAGALGGSVGVDPPAGSEFDQSFAFNQLSDYLVVRFGGGMIRYGYWNYYCHDHITLGLAVGLRGCPNQGRDTRSEGGIEAIDAIHNQPGLVFRANRGVRFEDNFVAESVTCRRSGIVAHTTLAGALDFQLTFQGTGMTPASAGSKRGVIIRDCNFYGFAFGIDAQKTPGCRIINTFGDCSTLILLRSSGETCFLDVFKRKPILTNNAAIQHRIVEVTALFDSAGNVGLTLAEDVSALGLTTGQRVGSQKLPPEFVSQRRTVTILSATSIRLEGEAWDAAYASYALTAGRSVITWQPGCASGVTAFYNSGGNVGVQTLIDMPFQPGHFALLGCQELPPRGFHQVLTRVNARDFVLNRAWDAALSGATVALCELAAMPNNRRHNSVVSHWGTTEGFAYAVVGSDGIRIRTSNKGGSGGYIDGGACNIETNNEGGSIGELDLNDPDTRGLVIKQPRTIISGDLKSTGTALDFDFENDKDSATSIGMELVDNGQASLRVATGGAMLINPGVRGAGRVKLDTIEFLYVHGGELRPSGITGAVAADIRRTHWEYPDKETFVSAHATHVRKGWDAAGVLTDLETLTTGGLTLTVPITAPNLPTGYRMTGATTSATPARLTTDGAAAGASNIGPVVANASGQHARLVRIEVRAERTGGASGAAGDSAIWLLNDVMLTRDVGVATTAVAGGGTALVPTRSRAAGSGYRLDVTADTTNSGLNLTVTGVATTDITWAVRMTEL